MEKFTSVLAAMTQPWAPAQSSVKSTCTASNPTNRIQWCAKLPFDDDRMSNTVCAPLLVRRNLAAGWLFILVEYRFELFPGQQGRLPASLRVGTQPMRPFGWQLRSCFREKNREGSDERGQP